MFSIFKQTSGTQDGVLKELSEEQLAEVAGGRHHHHHHHHHHHKRPQQQPPVTGTTGTTGMPVTKTPGSPVTVGGVTYPSNSHW